MSDMDFEELGTTMEAAFDKAAAADVLDPPTEVPAETDLPAPETETELSVQPPAPDLDAQPEPIKGPSSWTAEELASWDSLPREAQLAIARREGETQQAITQKAEELSRYGPIEEILASRRQGFQVDGMSDAQGLQQLFALSDFAGRDPSGFVQWFSQQHGLAQTPPDNTQDYVDPDIQQLSQRLSGIEGHLTQAQQQSVTQQVEYATQIADTFAKEANAEGGLVHPHFEAVKPQMAALLRSGAAQDYGHAYEMAVWSNGETRKVLMEERAQVAEAERIKAAKVSAGKAVKAKGTDLSTTGVTREKPAKRTMEQTMGDAYDRSMGEN